MSARISSSESRRRAGGVRHQVEQRIGEVHEARAAGRDDFDLAGIARTRAAADLTAVQEQHRKPSIGKPRSKALAGLPSAREAPGVAVHLERAPPPALLAAKDEIESVASHVSPSARTRAARRRQAEAASAAGRGPGLLGAREPDRRQTTSSAIRRRAAEQSLARAGGRATARRTARRELGVAHERAEERQRRLDARRPRTRASARRRRAIAARAVGPVHDQLSEHRVVVDRRRTEPASTPMSWRTPGPLGQTQRRRSVPGEGAKPRRGPRRRSGTRSRDRAGETSSRERSGSPSAIADHLARRGRRPRPPRSPDARPGDACSSRGSRRIRRAPAGTRPCRRRCSRRPRPREAPPSRRVAQGRADDGRRALLDHLLVPPLEAALALADGDDRPRAVADAPGPRRAAGRSMQLLGVDGAVAEERARLGGRAFEGRRQILGRASTRRIPLPPPPAEAFSSRG